MKKKEEGLSLNTIIIASIVLISMVVLWAIFTCEIKWGNPYCKFNPETDVCEEIDCYYKHGKITLNLKKYDFCPPTAGSKLQKEECSKYRPKTICEKDPNNEECECDEYSYKTEGRINETLFDACCTMIRIEDRNPGGDSFICFESNMTIIFNNQTIICPTQEGMLYAVIVKDKCIKAHQKNECEKGNEDWIWNEIEIEHINATAIELNMQDCGYGEGDRYCKITHKEVYYTKEKICRKKTIKDLNCDELKREYGCKLFTKPNCILEWEYAGNKDMILFEFIERCGGK